MEDTTAAGATEEVTTATEVVEAEIVDTQVAVADDHDHAEGRGLPVVRALGDVGAGAGLVPVGAVVWFRTLAEVTAAGAGWTRETTLDGRFPIGAGTTFSQTFVEFTDYGASWAHSHADDHAHAGGSHTHGMQTHTHDLQNHTHGMQSHDHSIGHTHGIPGIPVLNDGQVVLINVGVSTNVATSTHTHPSPGNTNSQSNSTSGTPSNNTTTSPTGNTSGTPSNNTTDAGNSTTSTGNKLVGTTTADATWIPPSRAGIWARKL